MRRGNFGVTPWSVSIFFRACCMHDAKQAGTDIELDPDLTSHPLSALLAKTGHTYPIRDLFTRVNNGEHDSVACGLS
jgi:hypothetical protein